MIQEEIKKIIFGAVGTDTPNFSVEVPTEKITETTRRMLPWRFQKSLEKIHERWHKKLLLVLVRKNYLKKLK